MTNPQIKLSEFRYMLVIPSNCPVVAPPFQHEARRWSTVQVSDFLETKCPILQKKKY